MASLRSASTWLKVAFACLIIAVILFIVAFATSAWVSYHYRNDYQSIGLWKGRHCTGNFCTEGRFRFSFNYDFHHAVQALECLGLIFILLSLVVLILYIFVDSCRRRNALIAIIVFIFLSVFFIVVGIAVCASKYEDRGFSIAWSMGLAIAAAIFDFVAGVMCVLQIINV
ncbi:hypothetical protein LOTGIDRAFT_234917 [Lottia gigantea]|uniref:MARVEL domain-containing protein n=1 Tax=Lottia gigantea TaxID=225164 RepID=V4A2Y5_LOTGI|nr:hypothetical protein LOTGIDRAFT_234917 [Lottia gigantea]ESO87666.1 hypothetical protein LOTGIDRAFT_234917 [Lottia gigantea]